jgi:DNA-3-methyladenine glycosylase
MILPRSFYSQDTIKVARQLLGKYIVRNGHRLIITETEAYHGYKDKASHGHKRRTLRNTVMYDTVGHTYVYFTYGMHWMLNITTYKEGFPSAVLIRGVFDPVSGKHIDGPAKLTKFLGIDKSLNRLPIFSEKTGLHIEDSPYRKLKIFKSARIGINYAQESKEWLWRFYIDPTQLPLSAVKV